MQVQFDIPEDIARHLAGNPQQLNRAGLEAFALESIRSGKLSVAQARRLLGFLTRHEMDGFLKSRGLLLDTGADEVMTEVEVARRLAK